MENKSSKVYLTDRQIYRLNRALPENEKIQASRFGEVVDISSINSNDAKKIAENMAAFNARPDQFWHKKWNGI